MTACRALLIDVLLHPQTAATVDLPGWEVLIRQARVSQLLARLAVTLIEHDLFDAIADAPRRHLEAALQLQARQRQAARWEVEHLVAALETHELRLVLLKGAAYEMAGLPPARCRLFSDFDVLVPRSSLDAAELALMLHGWSSGYQDAYDQRYYRTWMHELPPMRHMTRQSLVDVHHNLIPDTAPLHPDPARLLEAAVPCPSRPDVFVLAPHDMILHSAVHLFHDGEFDHGLRDLFDLRELAAHFLRAPSDWLALVQRAFALDLARPLFHAFRYMERVLEVEIVAEAHIAMQSAAPARALQPALDAMFERGLQPNHESCRNAFDATARLSLYVRGHALRMPLRLLLPHLVRKSYRRLAPEPARLTGNPGARQP